MGCGASRPAEARLRDSQAGAKGKAGARCVVGVTGQTHRTLAPAARGRPRVCRYCAAAAGTCCPSVPAGVRAIPAAATRLLDCACRHGTASGAPASAAPTNGHGLATPQRHGSRGGALASPLYARQLSSLDSSDSDADSDWDQFSLPHAATGVILPPAGCRLPRACMHAPPLHPGRRSAGRLPTLRPCRRCGCSLGGPHAHAGQPSGHSGQPGEPGLHHQPAAVGWQCRSWCTLLVLWSCSRLPWVPAAAAVLPAPLRLTAPLPARPVRCRLRQDSMFGLSAAPLPGPVK